MKEKLYTVPLMDAFRADDERKAATFVASIRKLTSAIWILSLKRIVKIRSLKNFF